MEQLKELLSLEWEKGYSAGESMGLGLKECAVRETEQRAMDAFGAFFDYIRERRYTAEDILRFEDTFRTIFKNRLKDGTESKRVRVIDLLRDKKRDDKSVTQVIQRALQEVRNDDMERAKSYLSMILDISDDLWYERTGEHMWDKETEIFNLENQFKDPE